ncbi:MAG: sulfur carrier protein [Bermanella sp.]|jgi:sulfur carrier protein
MIQISVNSAPKTVDVSHNLTELLAVWGFDSGKVAVAINEDFVPRSAYAHTSLKAEDRVDVVAPVQGG